MKAAYCLPMSAAEVELSKSVAGDRDPPKNGVKNSGLSGDVDWASVVAAHSAALFADRDKLRPGERAVIMYLACSKSQAQIVLNYTRSYFTDVNLLKDMVQPRRRPGLSSLTNVDVAISTSNFRSDGGRPVLACIMDELALWQDENSASPDSEVYKAVKPAMASLPSATHSDNMRDRQSKGRSNISAGVCQTWHQPL